MSLCSFASRLFICATLVWSAPVLADAGTAAAEAEKLDQFLLVYKCAVAGSLERIHEHASANEHRRYLILDAGSEFGYVQCHFHDKDTAIYCEAASGYYSPRIKVQPAALSDIARQGFSTDASAGNFQFDMPVKDEGTLENIAGRMLQTLYRVYGARTGSVNIQAPLLLKGRRELPIAACIIS